MQLQIMQSVLDSAANAFIRWINEPPSTKRAPTAEELAAEKVRQEQEQAMWRAKVEAQIGEMQAQVERDQQQQVATKRSTLLASMKGLSSSSHAPNTGLLRQLRCKAHWGMMAARAINPDDARKYSQWSSVPDDTALSQCDLDVPQPPEPSSTDNFRTELYQAIVERINERLPLIADAKAKQRAATTLLQDRQNQVYDLKSRQETATTPVERQTSDDLLAAAMKELDAANSLKNEADAGVMKLQMEVDALKNAASVATIPASILPRKN